MHDADVGLVGSSLPSSRDDLEPFRPILDLPLGDHGEACVDEAALGFLLPIPGGLITPAPPPSGGLTGES